MDAHEKNDDPHGRGVSRDVSGWTPTRVEAELPRRISHAMRSPLGLIRGALTELVDAQAQGRTLQPERLLEFAVRGTAQLERMAERLSVAGRLQRVDEVSRTACDLVEITKAAMADIQATRSRRRVEVQFAGPAIQAGGQGDPALLRIAIAELVDNALRMAKQRVVVRVEASSLGVAVFVSDDGDVMRGIPGLGPELVHPAADGTGLGLGLGLAQRVVALHGGALSLTRAVDDEGSGSGLVARLDVPGFEARLA